MSQDNFFHNGIFPRMRVVVGGRDVTFPKMESTGKLVERIKELEAAIHDIAPWLLASFAEGAPDDYRDACLKIFELDKKED